MAIESISDTDNGHDSAYPIVTFMPVLTMQDLAKMDEIAPHSQYAIQIGCINESEHVSWDGSVMEYFDLFMILMKKGYDPLYPIRGEKARIYTGKKITKIIMSNSKRGSYDKILPQITEYAKQICEFVREYIYGAVSIPSFGAGGSFRKTPLAKSTIYTRRTREKTNPSLYEGEGGDEEPLFETGNLMRSIKYRIINVDIGRDVKRKISDAAKRREAKKRRERKTLTKKETQKRLREYERKSKSKEEKKTEDRLRKLAAIKRSVAGGKKLSVKQEDLRRDWWIRNSPSLYALAASLSTGRDASGRYIEDYERTLIEQRLREMRLDMRRLGIDEDYIKGFNES